MNSNVIDEKCSKKCQRKDALRAPPSRRLYNSSLSNITEDWFIDNLFIEANLGCRMALSYISPLNVRRGSWSTYKFILITCSLPYTLRMANQNML